MLLEFHSFIGDFQRVEAAAFIIQKDEESNGSVVYVLAFIKLPATQTVTNDRIQRANRTSEHVNVKKGNSKKIKDVSDFGIFPLLILILL